MSYKANFSQKDKMHIADQKKKKKNFLKYLGENSKRPKTINIYLTTYMVDFLKGL